MRDRDMRVLEEKYENLFSGKVEEDDTSLDSILNSKDKDEKDEDEKDERDDKDSDDSNDSDESDSSDDYDNSSDSDDSDESDYSDETDDESEDDENDGDNSGGDSGIQSKVKQLQKQYNDLLVDAFERYAAECIENALGETESSFGENIADILDKALQDLKEKILGDLGVEDSCPMGDVMGMGGMEMEIGDEPEVTFGSEVGGIPTIELGSEDEVDDPEEDEEDDEDEEDEEVEEAKKCKGKGKRMVKESSLAAEFYGFV